MINESKDRKKIFLKLNIGGPSVVLLFTILILALFGVLSVRAAYAELKLARRSYEAVRNYYQADALTENELMKIAEADDIITGTEEYVSIKLDETSHIETVVSKENGSVRVISRKYVAEPVDGYSGVGFEINNMFDDGELYDY